MSNIDKQALREEFRLMQAHYRDPADRARRGAFISRAEALLDENLQLQREKDATRGRRRWHCVMICDRRGSNWQPQKSGTPNSNAAKLS